MERLSRRKEKGEGGGGLFLRGATSVLAIKAWRRLLCGGICINMLLYYRPHCS